MNQPNVLIVEDDRALSLALAAAVRQAGATPALAPSAALARRQLEESASPFAAMILDIGLPDENGLRFLASLPAEGRPPVAVITAHGEIENTISARKLGVREFFPKPLDFGAFKAALQQILRQPPPAKRAGSAAHSSAYIGAAPAMRAVFQQIAHACASDEPVLICGETGSGRSLTAEVIHRHSGRAASPLAQLRPGAEGPALSFRELAEALTRAADGSLVLDDIAGFPLESQGEIVRQWEACSSGFPRILAISSNPLRNAVERGQFRSDLFYRLQVLELRLPPLRQRIEDLPALFSFFLAQLQPGRDIAVEDGALNQLRDYPWPGNLRELRNVASFALTVGGSSGTILREHLPAHIASGTPGPLDQIGEQLGQALDAWLDQRAPWRSYRALAEAWERLLIQRLLRRFDGKLARLAGALRANRSTLRRKLRDL